MHEQPLDRRRASPDEERAVTFVQAPSGFTPPFDQVTSVSVVPFTTDGRIVATILPRGVDLPGGHVRVGEQSIEETARREAYEEAAVTLGDMHAALVVESDLYGTTKEDLTYMVMVTAQVTALDEFVPVHESLGRAVLDVDEFLARYTAGDGEMMRDIVTAARAALHNECPDGGHQLR